MHLDIIRSLYYTIRLGINPENTKMVFKLSGAIRDKTLKKQIVDELLKNPDIAPVLTERPPIKKLSILELQNHPPGSLGQSMLDFFDRNQLDPGIFPDFEDDTPFDYFRTRMGQTHDYRHVLTGYGRDIFGEAAIQAFDFAQMRQPVPAIICALALFRTAMKSTDQVKSMFAAIVDGYRMGEKAVNLLSVDLSSYHDLPLQSVQQKLNIQPAKAA